MKTSVIDAGIALRALLPTQGDQEMELLQELIRSGDMILAPELWKAEVTSVLRRYEAAGLLREEETNRALEDALSLPVEFVGMDAKICRASLVWARKLNQSKAYDALYLALAETRGADFWTADERLWKRCRDAGLAWVKMAPGTKCA